MQGMFYKQNVYVNLKAKRYNLKPYTDVGNNTQRPLVLQAQSYENNTKGFYTRVLAGAFF